MMTNDVNEAGKIADEMIEAGKDVLVDMTANGSFQVSELPAETVKDSVVPALLSVGGYSLICIGIGVVGTLGVQHIVKKIREKKEADEINKAFEDKQKAEEEAKNEGAAGQEETPDSETK